jgi:ribosomal protein S1
VASSTPKGVFVRFLGRLTGMATVSQLSDSFVSDPAGLFTQGQSVRARVVEINENLGRFTLTTKQSQCFSPDATYLKSFFAAEQKVGLTVVVLLSPSLLDVLSAAGSVLELSACLLYGPL